MSDAGNMIYLNGNTETGNFRNLYINKEAIQSYHTEGNYLVINIDEKAGTDQSISRPIRLDYRKVNGGYSSITALRTAFNQMINIQYASVGLWEGIDTITVRLSDKMRCVYFDPILFDSGDTIKVTGDTFVVDGITTNNWNVVQNQGAVSVNSPNPKEFINYMKIEIIGDKNARLAFLK
jgi:hypothetical protein